MVGTLPVLGQGSEFTLAEPEPLDQGNVAGTDKVAAAALDAVLQAEFAGFVP